MDFFFFFFLFFRIVLKKKLYKVSFPRYDSLKTQSCESTGQETVRNLVERIFKKSGNTRLKPPLENMLFYNANNEYLNVGLPVGVLSTEETYKCSFKKKLNYHPSDLCRQYAVEDFSIDWNLGYFLVSFSEGEITSGVSEFSRIISSKMKVDFFNDETIYEALVRDKRFIEEKLRSCKATDTDEVQISLSSGADNIQGKCIKILSVREEDTALPEHVPPRSRPSSVTTARLRITPIKIKREPTSATSSSTPTSLTPVDSSTPSTTGTSVKTGEKSGPLVEITCRTIDGKHKELTVKNEKELFKQHAKFERFALKKGVRSYICDLEELTEVAKSVGAVFTLDSAKQPFFFGTCFRIGTEYIITNNHVIEYIEKLKVAINDAFVDFNFKKADESHAERRYIDNLVVRSGELDYAILKMKKTDYLPPCICSHGFSIMDPDNSDWSELHGLLLRLIGHPQGHPKQIDLRCTVDASPQDSLKYYVYTIRRGKKEAEKECLTLKDKKRGTYQSSDFFNGSSGSPGIICLPSKKFLVFLHCRGFVNEQNKFFIEQGVLLTEIYKDVDKQIKDAQLSGTNNPLKDIKLQDIFRLVDSEPEDQEMVSFE